MATAGEGSIPACAGEPDAANRALNQSRVYPRVCGGATGIFCLIALRSGLSPRVRGSLTRIKNGIVADGSIPACAGEP